jgi:hypothetical protein
MKRYDILIGDDYDLLIDQGDFLTGESLNQEIGCLLAANQGDFRQHVKAGVGLSNYILEEGSSELNREIRLQFKMDNKTIKSLTFNAGNIQVDAVHKE